MSGQILRLIVWCTACQPQQEIAFRDLVAQGRGMVPITRLKFRCKNCGSRHTDKAVSGSHMTPKID